MFVCSRIFSRLTFLDLLMKIMRIGLKSLIDLLQGRKESDGEASGILSLLLLESIPPPLIYKAKRMKV